MKKYRDIEREKVLQMTFHITQINIYTTFFYKTSTYLQAYSIFSHFEAVM